MPPEETCTPEREQTDESLRVEREKSADVIAQAPVLAEQPDAAEALLAEQAAVLAAEREATDKDLSLERARHDHAVATRDEFLGIVSHDLRGLLAAVIGFATRIEQEASRENPREQVIAYTQRIHRSGARMERLIHDLVDLASINAGSLLVVREMGPLPPVVTEAVEGFQAEAAARGVLLVQEITEGLPVVSFDGARILQVLNNLISNALKFTARGGRVLVHVERSEEAITICVSDTGVGIPKDKLDAVFERFLQVHDDRRGVGLGLYIAKCIVQGHGGTIGVESTVGEGSQFTFTLPLANVS